jgi:hypothetical protein
VIRLAVTAAVHVAHVCVDMCFFISFIPATFWINVGYFVLFSSSKTNGGIRIFGQALAI